LYSREKARKRWEHLGRFYIRDPNLFEKLREILDREGKSLSEWIHEQARDYVRRHEPGNPQLLLTSFGPDLMDPQLRFRLCKYGIRGEDLHGPEVISWCYLRPHRPRFVGMEYQLCERCSSWRRRAS